MTQAKPSSKALIIYNKKLLLFLRDNDPSIPDPNTWSLVGGEVDNNESHEQTITREMYEEMNVVPQDIRYLGKIHTPDGTSHAIFLVKPTLEEVEKIRIGNEGQKVEFFSFNDIRKLDLAKNVKRYFDLYGSYLSDVIQNDLTLDPKMLGLS